MVRLYQCFLVHLTCISKPCKIRYYPNKNNNNQIEHLSKKKRFCNHSFLSFYVFKLLRAHIIYQPPPPPPPPPPPDDPRPPEPDELPGGVTEDAIELLIVEANVSALNRSNRPPEIQITVYGLPSSAIRSNNVANWEDHCFSTPNAIAYGR